MIALLILTTYFPRLVRGARPSPTLGRRVFQTTALSVLKVPNDNEQGPSGGEGGGGGGWIKIDNIFIERKNDNLLSPKQTFNC